jgi:phosphoglycerate kinase
MDTLTLDDVTLRDKRVLVRVDFNVPLTKDESGSPKVADDTRIRAALPTIREIVEAKGKAILISHLGRPGGQPDPALSLACVADRLEDLLGDRVRFSSNTVGDAVQDAISGMPAGGVILLENTRFESGEKSNDDALAEALAELADLYVNDAFGAAHRAHASTAGVATFAKQAVMGRLFEKEIEVLTRVRDNPDPPLVALLGGAKVSDKIGTVRRLADHAERLLIGGAMSYTFLKVRGVDVGASRVEDDRLEVAEELSDMLGDRLILPSDHVAAATMEDDIETQVVEGDIPSGLMGLDIGPATVERFKEALGGAATIVWNGPMGVFEHEPFAQGTRALAEAIAQATDQGAYSVVGGGDSVAALKQSGHLDRISHVSTGGGAMLTLLEGADLPGLTALDTD